MATSTIKQHVEKFTITIVYENYSISANGQTDFNVDVTSAVAGYAHWSVIDVTTGKVTVLAPNYYKSGTSVVGTLKNTSSSVQTGTAGISIACWS